MSGFGKAITAILGIIALLACLLTIGILGYTAVKGDFNKIDLNDKNDPGNGNEIAIVDVTPLPTIIPEIDPNVTTVPVSVQADPNHIHNYIETVVEPATCTQPGLIKYECNCGDSYTVDILAKGHIPDDWEVVVEPTETQSGYRVQKCIYCDEILSKEILPATGSGNGTSGNGTSSSHQHLYVATVEREATCTMAGLRKLTCECGSFYTEIIPALGHVAKDWDVIEEATATTVGNEARVCAVCGAILDMRSIAQIVPSPSPQSSASASASAGTSATAASGTASTASKSGEKAASPSPAPTPHTHKYQSYVVTPATCTEKGVRSYVCTCGSSYAETIDLDLNNHHFVATFVPATETQQGYTIYTCSRCNYSYKDNYVMPLNDGVPFVDESNKNRPGQSNQSTDSGNTSSGNVSAGN
ncbi:MAG: hypothetical protein K6A38_03880 [Lachnospiraceae bacterium]|nr:hypothetical protein [Lachnospiraceae bacterium]